MDIFPLFLGCALILIGVAWQIMRSIGTRVVLAALVGYWLGSRERKARRTAKSPSPGGNAGSIPKATISCSRLAGGFTGKLGARSSESLRP